MNMSPESSCTYSTKSKFIRKTQGIKKIRRLSERQWNYVIKTAEEMAENPLPSMREHCLLCLSFI